jgi:hypothetical protein
MDWRILYVISLEMLYIPFYRAVVLLKGEASAEPFNKTTYYRKNINTCIFGQRSQRAIIDFLSSCEMCVVYCSQCKWTAHT